MSLKTIINQDEPHTITEVFSLLLRQIANSVQVCIIIIDFFKYKNAS